VKEGAPGVPGDIKRTIMGSGDFLSASWDGTDDAGKQVEPGNYTAILGVRTLGGLCGDDSDFKSIPLTVTAIQPTDRTWPSCVADPKAPAGSTVTLTSGNLSHSQTLFTLPNSKFFKEFSLAYNSLSNQNDVLGVGWTHTFNLRLLANNNGSYTLIEGDGEKTVLYDKGGYFSPQNGNYPALTLGGGTFTLQHKNGVTYSFDSEKKITAISDRNSNTISFTYLGNNLISVTDPNGRNVNFTYSSNKIIAIADPSGNVHTFSYSGQNLTGVSSQIAGVGTGNWAYTYYDNSFLRTKTDPLNQTTTYSYDNDRRLVQSIDPEGKSRSFVYTPAQSLTRMTEKDGGVWKFRYDASLGALTEREDPYGYKEKYGFFPAGDPNSGRLQYIEDQRGKRTWFTYDSGGNGNLTSVTDALGNRTEYAHNSIHKVTRIEYPGAPRPAVHLDYNAQGNLTYFKDPEGNETQFGYDSRGNLTSLQSIGNNLLNLTYTYDPFNYLRARTDNRTGAVVQLEYDPAGNLRVHRDPMTPPNDTTFEYNGFNKVNRVTDPEGNIIHFSYDLMGNLASMTDANRKTTAYEYNYRGQVIRITDALNNVTQFAYGSGCPSCGTGVEKLTGVTDARGKTTTFEYDLVGRLIKEVDPLGKFKTYSYNVLQNKIIKTDEDRAVIQYTYDDLNRLSMINYPDSSTLTFGYDARSNLISAANPNIGYAFTYNLNDRVTSTRDSNNKTISYQYNTLNQRTRMVADGRIIDYTYDLGNRLYQVMSPEPVATITYDLEGRRQTLSYPNLVTTTYSYNKSGFLTHLLTRYNQQTVIDSFAYTLDGMGNRTSTADRAGVHNYGYDNTYQLTQATHPNMPLEEFTYDPVGNRLSSEGQAPSAGRSTEYVYDFENRLIEVNYPGMVARYKYDPFGRRIEKNVNGTVTRYLYDGPNIVAEYDASNNVKAQYIFTLDIDDPLTLTQGGNTYYYQKDGLGSVVNLTDTFGNVVKTYTYKSFGEIHAESGSLVQPFTFTGREYDPESGLYYYRARYYDPRAGRFLTKDPIGFLGGHINLYRYVGNNPLNHIDPRGLWRSSGHRILTSSSMKASNAFTSADIALAVRANLYVDRIFNQFNDPAHYMPGTQAAAEALISKLLEEAIQFELAGLHKEAMEALGEGLHTVQDRYSHFEQNAGWAAHIGRAECDDPKSRAREFAAALDASIEYVEQFLIRTGRR
jgi:RHS repeat-associated protein